MKRLRMAAAAAAAALAVVACGSGGSGDDSVTVNGDVPLVYTKRSTAVSLNPTNGAPFAPGGDLMLREKSSPSATEHNLTEGITQGQGDVSDPEVSYDGKKVVFALRCPTTNTSMVNGQKACTGRWNIWEYDMTAGLTQGTFRRLTDTTTDDDVDPAYLPAGRGFVFASNRQAKSRFDQIDGRTYYALDEYERERVLNLHTMDADGANVQQISFNQSHDRNPVVRPNGDIMFSRWEHVGDRNRFAIFRSKPDGTDMFVLYGAQSPGNSFLHPRDMDPKGAYKGQLASTLMPLSGTREGGALMFVDATNYSEYNTPANSSVAPQGGQAQATAQALNDGRGLSTGGRATTPYPLWDGTDRLLVAWRPCEVTKNGTVVPCASLTAEELASLEDDTMSVEQRNDAPIQDNVPAHYGIYMFDPARQQWLNVATPPAGYMFVDPVAIEARPEPNVIEPSIVDPVLAAQNLALVEVRSVYDTDGLQRMAEPMLVDADRPVGCTVGIAQTAEKAAEDTRATIADLKRIKDPADRAYGCAPARFVRAVRAVAPPEGGTGMRAAIGETDFEQQQILGYAPIEPDGSFRLHLPADTPLLLSVIDAEGRAFQTHTNWIQVRPGERRTCDGCHSPRRGGAINAGATANTMPQALVQAIAAQHQPGETMAALRTRLEPARLKLQADPVFVDDWADTTKPGVAARPSIEIKYTGNADAAKDLQTRAPTRGIVNYVEHIQPLWERVRGPGGAHTCTGCHADPAKLDLRGTVAGSGRLVSYDELLLGDPLLDANGQPVTRLVDGVPRLQRGPALVETSSGAANSAGQARKSRLTEILWGHTLLAGADARTAHPNPPATAPDHATLLNAAEKRLLAEWMDLGGQYWNDPFNPDAAVRRVDALSEETFTTRVWPVLNASCGTGCHVAGTVNRGFTGNRFILAGNPEGDYGAALSMVTSVCNAAANPLLARPSTVPHPAAALTQTTALLPAGSAGYRAIADWIASGCASSSSR